MNPMILSLLQIPPRKTNKTKEVLPSVTTIWEKKKYAKKAFKGEDFLVNPQLQPPQKGYS